MTHQKLYSVAYRAMKTVNFTGNQDLPEGKSQTQTKSPIIGKLLILAFFVMGLLLLLLVDRSLLER